MARRDDSQGLVPVLWFAGSILAFLFIFKPFAPGGMFSSQPAPFTGMDSDGNPLPYPYR